MEGTQELTKIDAKVELNDFTLCYDDAGQGKIPVIFIHGFPFDKSFWQPQMEFLQKSHRVIAYDIRGFGKSTSGEELETIPLFAEDLIEFMDRLEIPKAIVCGLSMGGYILLNAINLHPERFEAIILSDTQCIADTPETKEKRDLTILQILSGGVHEYADSLVKSVFCKNSLETKKELLEKVRQTILSTSLATLTVTLSALGSRQEICSSLNKITVPTLILCGKEDSLTPPIQAEFLRFSIANSIIHYIETAGHVSNLEQPDEFNICIESFITGLTHNSHRGGVRKEG